MNMTNLDSALAATGGRRTTLESSPVMLVPVPGIVLRGPSSARVSSLRRVSPLHPNPLAPVNGTLYHVEQLA